MIKILINKPKRLILLLIL